MGEWTRPGVMSEQACLLWLGGYRAALGALRRLERGDVEAARVLLLAVGDEPCHRARGAAFACREILSGISEREAVR